MAENIKIFVLVDPGQHEYFPILNIIQKQGATHDNLKLVQYMLDECRAILH